SSGSSASAHPGPSFRNATSARSRRYHESSHRHSTRSERASASPRISRLWTYSRLVASPRAFITSTDLLWPYLSSVMGHVPRFASGADLAPQRFEQAIHAFAAMGADEVGIGKGRARRQPVTSLRRQEIGLAEHQHARLLREHAAVQRQLALDQRRVA